MYSCYINFSSAQITQWDLIFYGTEAPAQPDDPTPVNNKQFGLFKNDIVHNDIDYDPNDRWSNMQQVINFFNFNLLTGSATGSHFIYEADVNNKNHNNHSFF